MKPLLQLCEVIKKEEIRDKLFDITIKSKDIAEQSKAGQFLHIKCSNNVLLRRPISICDVNDDEIRFIFEVRGEGTKDLSLIKIGDKVNILGPLGNGFTINDTNKKAVLIGGGIGIFPLFMVAKEYKENATVLLGFRDKSNVVLEKFFLNYGCKVKIATDDGSYGYKGFITDLLKGNKSDIIYACGPKPMLKKTADFAKKNNIFCEMSMEERMGCGVGACLVCTCKTVKQDSFTYKKVCVDGPVFNVNEVIFDD